MFSQKNRPSLFLVLISFLTVFNFVMFSVNQTPAYGFNCSGGEPCFYGSWCLFKVFYDCDQECRQHEAYDCDECSFISGSCNNECYCYEEWECECEGTHETFYVWCSEYNEIDCDPED